MTLETLAWSPEATKKPRRKTVKLSPWEDVAVQVALEQMIKRCDLHKEHGEKLLEKWKDASRHGKVIKF